MKNEGWRNNVSILGGFRHLLLTLCSLNLLVLPLFFLLLLFFLCFKRKFVVVVVFLHIYIRKALRHQEGACQYLYCKEIPLYMLIVFSQEYCFINLDCPPLLPKPNPCPWRMPVRGNRLRGREKSETPFENFI